MNQSIVYEIKRITVKLDEFLTQRIKSEYDQSVPKYTVSIETNFDKKRKYDFKIQPFVSLDYSKLFIEFSTGKVYVETNDVLDGLRKYYEILSKKGKNKINLSEFVF